MESLTHSLVVEENDVGQRADRLQVPDGDSTLSRAQLQRLIREGRLTRNGVSLQTSSKLRRGDRLSLRQKAPAMPLVPAGLSLDVIYEDADLLVVNKPAHLTVHPTPETAEKRTLVHGLLARGTALSTVGAPYRPGIVHRLDRGTTGAMVIAKNNHAHRHLVQQFADRQVRKTYWALVEGKPMPAAGTLESRLARHPRCRHRFASTEGEGKWAKTLYRTLATRDHLSLLEIELPTGRTHQIRVHMAELGTAVVADGMYGRRKRRERWPAWAQPLVDLDHQALHASSLSLMHPSHQTSLIFRAPLPTSWAAVASSLAGERRADA